jgi:hypothetical protein
MLSKQIFVKECKDGNEKYLYADDYIGEEFEDKDIVGIYELKDTKTVSVKRELK